MHNRTTHVVFRAARWRTATAALLIVSLVLTIAAAMPGQAAARTFAALPLAEPAFAIREIDAEPWPASPIGPGTTLRMMEAETTAGRQRIGIVTVDLNDPLIDVRVAPAGPPVAARSTVADQARRDSRPGETVIAAVNGDFFDTSGPYAGIPVGAMVVGGAMLTNPWGPALGMLPDGSAVVGMPGWQARVEVLDEAGNIVAARPVDGINRRRDGDRLIVYTSAYGPSTATNEWGAEAVLSGLPLPLTLAYDAAGSVVRLHPGTGLPQRPADPDIVPTKGNTPIPADGLVLSGHGEAGAFIAEHLKPGRAVRLVFTVAAPWEQAEHVIGGQPVLLAGGQIAPDVAKGPQGSTPAPRTAAGIDAAGNLVLVTVDGRQAGSAGLTLTQFAQLLQDLGVRDALNLDGGGSTTLYARPAGHLQAAVLNQPADGTSRRVANSLQVVSRAPAGSQIARFWLEPAAQRVLPGTEITLTPRAQDEHFGPVDLGRQPVQWSLQSAAGSASIDPDGRLLALRPGDVHVTAQLRDAVAEARITVLGSDDIGEVRLQPTPAVAAWQWGQQVQLGVEVRDRHGQRLALNAARLVWEADPGLGTVDEAGRLTLAEVFPAGQLKVGLQVPVAGTGETEVLPLGSWALALPGDDGAEVVFPDTVAHWARRDISALMQRQVVRGYPDGLFRPDGAVTRAEMVQMLVGALTVTDALPDWVSGSELYFADADALPDWAVPAIAVAQAGGLIGGFEDGTFRAGETVTREQAVLMLMRAAALAGVDLGGPGDADADLAAFADRDEIGEWARDAVALAQRAGLVQGFEDGTFRPKQGLTRAQAAALLVRLLGW